MLLRLVVGGTVGRWLPNLSATALGIPDPDAARAVQLVTWVLSLHALVVVPMIIDNVYLLVQARSRRRCRLYQAGFPTARAQGNP